MNMESISAVAARALARCTECGDCLLWPGAKDTSGKPMVRLPGTRKLAPLRRVVLQAEGRWIEGRLAVSSCARVDCVAPAHAVPMTRRALSRRSAQLTGYHRNPARNARISAARRPSDGALADEATREAIRASDMPQRALAARYGVAQSTISDLLLGVTYKQYGSPWAGLGGR